MKKEERRCWHIHYLQKNKEMLETLEVTTTPQVQDQNANSDDIEYVLPVILVCTSSVGQSVVRISKGMGACWVLLCVRVPNYSTPEKFY